MTVLQGLKYRMTCRTVTNTRSVALSSFIASALLLPACGGASEDSSPLQGEPVAFAASDGIGLTGRVFGEGSIGVVLAHMGRPGDMQADFYPLARALAERGYLALTYNRRGVCGPVWTGVLAGIRRLREQLERRHRRCGARALEGHRGGGIDRCKHRRDGIAPCCRLAPGGAGGIDRDRRSQSRKRLRLLARGAQGARWGQAVRILGRRPLRRGGCGPRMARLGPGAEAGRDPPGSAHGTDMLISTEPTARTLVRLVLSFLMRAVPPDREEDE